MAVGAQALVRARVLAVGVEVKHKHDPDVAKVLQPDQRVRRHVALEHNPRARRRRQRPLPRRACISRGKTTGSGKRSAARR